jgi:hypothetical protein
MSVVRQTLLAACLLLPTAVAGAAALGPELTIRLHPEQGEPIELGRVMLTPEGDGYRFQVRLDESRFEDQFLSMRPFKCLPHPAQVICHLPYPYENQRLVTAADLTDLEYDLLFLHKTPEEYGINAWNGLYFALRMTADGFEGELRETDLNVLASPPEDGDLRPIKRAELYPASDRHWPRRISIR